MRIIILAALMLSAQALASDNAYFQSAAEPAVNGTCVQIRKVGANWLWHCQVELSAPGKSSGPKKNIEDFTPAEKAAAGYKGNVESSVTAGYKVGGSVGHHFSGSPVFATTADKAAGKPKSVK